MTGLSIADARELAEAQNECRVEFIGADEPLTADIRTDRVRALTRNGVVVSADAG